MRTCAVLVALAVLVLAAFVATRASAHHPPPPVPRETTKLVSAYERLHAAAKRSPRAHAGRNLWRHGRTSDGKRSYAALRRDLRRLWTQLHPAIEAEHRRRQIAAQVPARLVRIRGCESGHDYRAVNPSSGAGGAYQFLPSTWRSVGGRGLPQHASPAEQDRRAIILYAGGAGASHWNASRHCWG